MTFCGDIHLPTAYFPPVSYFVHLLRHETIYIEQMETFPKQTYRNRCEIMTAAGKSRLIVPITKPQGNHTLTRDIRICYREPWREQHWKTLQTAYSSSPFYSYYADSIRPLFESPEPSLLTHNQAILQTISRLIGIDLPVEITTDYMKEPLERSDYRKKFSPKSKSQVIEFPRYPQVFEYKYGFIPDLSLLDLLFNMGPETVMYIKKLATDSRQPEES
jgi:hypothetical protein